MIVHSSAAQVISCDIDGIIHRQQALLLRGVRVSVLFVNFVLRVIGCCMLAISFSLGTDGMLLALCDHGFERSG